MPTEMKEAHEDILIRQDVSDDTHGILGAGQHQTGEESAQRHGHAQEGGNAGEAEAEYQSRQQKDFPGSRADHGVHEPVKQEF